MENAKPEFSNLPTDLRWALTKYPAITIGWFFASAIQSGVFFAFTLLSAVTVDELLVKADVKQLPHILLLYLGASVVSVLAALVVNLARGSLALRSVNDWRSLLIKRFEIQYDQTLVAPRERTLELALSDANEQRQQWAIWQKSITAFFSIFIGILIAISLNWKLLVVTAVFALVSSGIAFLFAKAVTRQSQNYFGALGVVTSSLERLLSLYSSLSPLDLLKRFRNQYQNNQKKVIKAQAFYSGINTLNIESQMILTSLTGILTYLVFINERSQNTLSIGVVSAAVGIMTELIVAMRDLAQSIPERSQYAGCLDRMKDFLNEPVPIPEVRGVPFELPSGLTMVTGITGSGKTTKLVQTALQASDRQQVRMLPQQIEYPEIQVAQILSELPKDSIILDLQGLISNQVLQRNFSELSGGERQLVALMCVLSAKPKILLLDESLSAMNPSLATKTIEIIKQHRSGMVTLLITHQPHLQQLADSIVEVNAIPSG